MGLTSLIFFQFNQILFRGLRNVLLLSFVRNCMQHEIVANILSSDLPNGQIHSVCQLLPKNCLSVFDQYVGLSD